MRFLSFTSILLLFILVLTPLSISSAIHHDCAPPIPPPVSGTLVQPPAIHGVLFINEVLLIPGSRWNCSDSTTYTQNDAWLEIYNTQNQAFDLYSAHMNVDNGPNTPVYYFPFGAAIAAHDFLVIFPITSQLINVTGQQTFRLLLGNTVIDEVTVPPLRKEQSYARIPDGSSNWFITNNPTIDANNSLLVATPTPHKTKAQATATAHANSKDRKSSGSATGSSRGDTTDNSDNTDTSSGQEQSKGIQPSWSSIKHPNEVTVTPTIRPQSVNNASSVSSSGLDVSHKLLLTLLAIALVLSLFWCWRLFRSS